MASSVNVVEFSDTINLQEGRKSDLDHIDVISDKLSSQYGLKRNAPMAVDKIKASKKIKFERGIFSSSFFSSQRSNRQGKLQPRERNQGEIVAISSQFK